MSSKKKSAILRNTILGFSIIILILTVADADDKPSLRRFGFWTGAGSGILTTDKSTIPLRLNLGAEIYVGAERQLGIGYTIAAPVSSDSQLFRMVHYFPAVRYFVIDDILSLRFSPGIAMQGMGMMGSSSQSGTTSIGLMTSSEYRFEIEPDFHIGIEAAYEHLSAAPRTSIPSTNIWTLNANFHFDFSGHMSGHK